MVLPPFEAGAVLLFRLRLTRQLVHCFPSRDSGAFEFWLYGWEVLVAQLSWGTLLHHRRNGPSPIFFWLGSFISDMHTGSLIGILGTLVCVM